MNRKYSENFFHVYLFYLAFFNSVHLPNFGDKIKPKNVLVNDSVVAFMFRPCRCQSPVRLWLIREKLCDMLL